MVSLRSPKILGSFFGLHVALLRAVLLPPGSHNKLPRGPLPAIGDRRRHSVSSGLVPLDGIYPTLYAYRPHPPYILLPRSYSIRYGTAIVLMDGPCKEIAQDEVSIPLYPCDAKGSQRYGIFCNFFLSVILIGSGEVKKASSQCPALKRVSTHLFLYLSDCGTSTMVSAAFLIYSGIMPLIKTFLCIICGYVLAWKGLFPPAAARGASVIAMNVSLPALIFASIVPAFTPQNVSAIGPLFLIAFVYQIIGLLFGAIIREVCYVPRNFWQGIVIVSGLSNWGNLPNAIVQSVTQQTPFDPATDPALGVSFVAIFIVVVQLGFWGFGGAQSLKWDYLPNVPQGEDAELRLSWKQKPIGSLITRYILRQQVPPIPSSTHGTKECSTEMGESKTTKDIQDDQTTVHPSVSVSVYDGPTPRDSTANLSRSASKVSLPVNLFRRPAPPPPLPHTSTESSASDVDGPPGPSIVLRIYHVLSAFLTPITLTLIFSLIIALVRPLKALFVDVSQAGGPNWKAPDGKPPLAFAIDTARFIGDIVVPLGLILLGSSFARLKMPRPLSRLPINAMIAVTLAKMLILPVIGVFLVQRMVKGGLIHPDAKVQKFVAMLLSGTPAAVNQLIITSLYAPEGKVDTLSAFLLIQYVFLFFSSSALTVVALLLA